MAALTLTSFLALSLLAISMILIITRLLRHGRGKNYPPGPKGIPIFGSLLSLIFDKRDQHLVVSAWNYEHGPIVSFRLFNTRFHILGGDDVVKEAFRDSRHMCDRLTFVVADAISGKKNTGVVFANGSEWQDQRRFIASVFRKVDTSAVSFQAIIGEAVECLIREIEKAGCKSVDPHLLINTSIANIIVRTITGETYEFEDKEFQDMITETNRLIDLMGTGGLVPMVPFLSKLPLPRLYEIKAGYKHLHDFVKIAIRRRSATFNPDEDQPTNFVESLLTERATRTAAGSWTDLDQFHLEFTLVDLMVAGWETSTITVTWMLHNMAVHKADQERVRDEIRSVVGDGRRPLYSDHRNLPVTEAAIMESARFTPTIDFPLAHVASRDCKLGGYDVSRGDLLTTNMWYLMQSPKLWDRPEEFRLSRFIDSSGALKKDLEPLFFGNGRRVCPGEQLARMELFMFTTYILQNFKLSLPDGAPRSIPATHALNNRPSSFNINFTKIR